MLARTEALVCPRANLPSCSSVCVQYPLKVVSTRSDPSHKLLNHKHTCVRICADCALFPGGGSGSAAPLCNVTSLTVPPGQSVQRPWASPNSKGTHSEDYLCHVYSGRHCAAQWTQGICTPLKLHQETLQRGDLPIPCVMLFIRFIQQDWCQVAGCRDERLIAYLAGILAPSCMLSVAAPDDVQALFVTIAMLFSRRNNRQRLLCALAWLNILYLHAAQSLRQLSSSQYTVDIVSCSR